MTLTEKEAPTADASPEPDSPPEDANPSRVMQLIIALVLITAAFIALGWGYLLLFIAILFAIVMLHEFGHFITAKHAGMKVTEYFVGFGPRLWSVRRGETEYGVKAIPAGGYVRIVGMTTLEELDPADEARSYREATFPRRFAVGVAGSTVHFILAYLLLFVMFVGTGYPTAVSPNTVSSIATLESGTSPAARAHLQAGDEIVGFDGHRATITQVVKAI